MRGDDNQQEGIFSYVSPEKRVPTDHPLRAVRKMKAGNPLSREDVESHFKGELSKK